MGTGQLTQDSNASMRPMQRISTAKKTGNSKESKQWRNDNVNYFADLTSKFSTARSYYEELFKVAAGYLDTKSYDYVTNPLNTDKAKYDKTKKAILNNYDIITPIIMTFMGEKIDRAIKPTVAAINSDIDNIKAKEKARLISEQVENVFVQEINRLKGLGVDENELMSLHEIDTVIDNIKDEKAITGAKALEYIMQNNEILRKFRKMFFHWVVTYNSCSLKNVLNNDIEYEPVSPMNVNYIISENQDFIEDGEAASITFYMSLSEIMDKYYLLLEEKDLKNLEERTNNSVNRKTVRMTDTDTFMSKMRDKGAFGTGDLGVDSLNLNKLEYVNWKSLVKIGKVKTTDIEGQEVTFEVDEDYKPVSGEEVDWKWVNEVWEGYRLNDDIIFGVQKVPFQRSKFDNPSSCKLLINGRCFMNSHFRHKGPVERLLPYQKRYNVINYQLEKLINKNKDKIMLMPLGLIPDNEDMDIFDMMFYADNDSYLFADDSNKDKIAAMQNIRVLDLSLSQNMSFLSTLLQQIKTEAEESVGFNRQRLGNTNSSDGKGANEDAVQRSSTITSEIFEQFEELEEREWQGLLDLSKFAWKDGKKEVYLSSEGRKKVIEVDKEYTEMEFGVKATRSSREIKKLEKVRAESQAMIQNGITASTLARLEQADSLSEMEDILIEAENKITAQAQETQEAEAANAQAIVQAETERETSKLEFDYYKTDADNMTKERVALINSETSLITSDLGVQAPTSSTESNTEAISSRRTEEFKKNQMDREKLDIEKQKLQLTRETNKVALENKVVGEK